MEVIHERCAGLDVHKETVVGCVRVSEADEVPYRDLGPLYFARLDHDRTAQRLARRIKELGYEVELRKAA